MSENGPVLPPEVYRRRRIVAVIALLAVILLLVAGVTSMVGMINGKKDATVASTATASGAPFQSFSAPKLLRQPRLLVRLLRLPQLPRLVLR